jgi:hypothetical protein
MPALGHYSQELSRALDRFVNLGANLRRGRIRVYEETLLRAAENPKGLDPRLINAAVAETIDLAAISSLQDKSLRAHTGRLSHISDGEAIYADAREDDPGRQHAFPFLVACRFNVPNAEIAFEEPSDVYVELDDQAVLVECKRVGTQAALGRRLRQAYRQLSEHRRADFAGLGVIAIEITRVLNPDFLELAVDEPLPLAEGLHYEVEDLFVNAREHLDRAARNRRMDAQADVLLFRAQCFLRRADERRRVCYTSWRAQPTAAVGSERFIQISNILACTPAFAPTINQGAIE